MSGLIAGLAGAPQAANTAGGYYQSAANNIATQTSSPEAKIFAREQMNATRPLFAEQDAQLTAANAAQGIGTSGAGRYNFGNLAGQQSGALAGAVAPLYSQAESQYGSIIGQMPGAQEGAYQGAIQDVYAAIQDAGQIAAGMPPTGKPGAAGQDDVASWGDPNDPNYVPGFAPSPDDQPYYSTGNSGYNPTAPNAMSGAPYGQPS